jgi:hypothetical protein
LFPELSSPATPQSLALPPASLNHTNKTLFDWRSEDCPVTHISRDW